MKKSPSELKKLSFNQQQWNKVMEDNNRLLNDTLLYLENLQDVDLSGIGSYNILKYNSTSEKFEPAAYAEVFTTTTTTTTTTTPFCTAFSANRLPDAYYGNDTTPPNPKIRANLVVSPGEDSTWRKQYAIDRTGNTYWAANATGMPQWWAFNFGGYYGHKFRIQKVRIKGYTNSLDNAPKTFQIQGSDTGAWSGEEDVLLSVSDAGSYQSGQFKEWEFENDNGYNWFRIYVTDVEDQVVRYVVIDEIEMMECLDNPYATSTTTTTTTTL